MGSAFNKSRSEPEPKLSTEWQKSKPILIFHETYSEESSEAISTPSCRSLDGDLEEFVKNIPETPALQDLEESVMQARAAEDYKQAKKAKARRNSVTAESNFSDPPTAQEPVLASSRNRSRVNTWDVVGAKRDLESDDLTEVQENTKADIKKRFTDIKRASSGSVGSEDSFRSLGSTDSTKIAKDRKKNLSNKVYTSDSKSPRNPDKK